MRRGSPLAALALSAAAMLVACGADPLRTAVALPAPGEGAPRDSPGIHNAVAYHEGFVSGSVPEGDAGFEPLDQIGVRNVEAAKGNEVSCTRTDRSIRGERCVAAIPDDAASE